MVVVILRVFSVGIVLLIHLWLPAPLAAVAPAAPVVPPRRLAIYYGWPSLVNGAAGDVARAAAAFERFDIVVLGDGLAHPAHADHAKTQEIIERLVARGTEVYGYVDMGINTQNLSIATAAQYVDEWAALGVNGIFWDDAGYDHGVDRSRQDQLIDVTHGRRLRVFINAWNPDDVFADDPAPTHLATGDLYLAESWLVGNDQYQDLAQWAAKADKLVAYRGQTGVRIAAISTGSLPNTRALLSGEQYQMGWWGAAMYNLDAFGYTDFLYSASGPGANRLSFPLRLDCGYGSFFIQEAVGHGRAGSYHTRRTDVGQIVVTGDGLQWGAGYLEERYCSAGPRRASVTVPFALRCLWRPQGGF